MIDIGIICYKNYWLLDRQIEHWNTYMKGDFRLILIDNTPRELRQNRPDTICIDTDNSFDGISAGQAYDFLFRQTTSDIVGICDPDCFFLNPDLLNMVEERFDQGYKYMGCSGTYPDFQKNIDAHYPDFAGHLAACLWGLFLTRELALENTWICEPPGHGRLNGWRVRKKVIDENIPRITWQGHYPFPDDDQIVFFGNEDKPQAFHLLKGCSSRQHLMPAAFERAMNYGKPKWVS